VNGYWVFTCFGWDLIALVKETRFWGVYVEVYASPELGHFGGWQLVFRAWKGIMA
jgi:hypothetical protein